MEKVAVYGFNSMAWHMILNILIDQDSGAFVDSIGQEETSLLYYSNTACLRKNRWDYWRTPGKGMKSGWRSLDRQPFHILPGRVS